MNKNEYKLLQMKLHKFNISMHAFRSIKLITFLKICAQNILVLQIYINTKGTTCVGNSY